MTLAMVLRSRTIAFGQTPTETLRVPTFGTVTIYPAVADTPSPHAVPRVSTPGLSDLSLIEVVAAGIPVVPLAPMSRRFSSTACRTRSRPISPAWRCSGHVRCPE